MELLKEHDIFSNLMETGSHRAIVQIQVEEGILGGSGILKGRDLKRQAEMKERDFNTRIHSFYCMTRTHEHRLVCFI